MHAVLNAASPVKCCINLFPCCPEPGITCGLSDIYTLCGKPAELTVQMNMDCEGTWFKDGVKVKHFH